MFIMSSMVVLGSEISMGSLVVSESLGWGIEKRSLKKGDAKYSILLRTGISTPSDARRTTRSFNVDIAITIHAATRDYLKVEAFIGKVPVLGMNLEHWLWCTYSKKSHESRVLQLLQGQASIPVLNESSTWTLCPVQP